MTPSSFLLIGDTQRTMWLERLAGREQNDREREAIIVAAARESVDAIFFLGDLVAVGSLPSQWEKFDQLIGPLRAKKTPLFSVFGNHDYFYARERARDLMTARFPHLAKSHWSAEFIGPMAVVTLDSNKQVLSPERWAEQLKWLRETLQSLDGNPAIRGITAILHHPPYTNSVRSRASSAVREEITPLFLAAKKTLALVSGHCHAYERFEVQGRTFLVSGGAGGPRARILPKKWHRLPDLFAGKSFRPFHFIRVDMSPTGAKVSVIGLDKGETEAKEIDSFQLSYR